MDVILVPLLNITIQIIGMYIWCVIISALLSVLVSFQIINPYNQFVSVVGGFLDRITDPLLNPIRRFMPDLGGIDISPIILILALRFLEQVIAGFGRKLVSSSALLM